MGMKNGFISQKGGVKINPLHIRLDVIDMYQGRREVREQGVSSIEESYFIIRAVDPELKETTEMLGEFHYLGADL